MSSQFKKQYANQGVLKDPTRGVFLDWGPTPPTDGTPGYGVGAIWFDTDAAVGSQWLRNDGSVTSCDFNLISGGVDLSGLLATAAEINQAADPDSNTEIVTTTNVITAAENGKTFYLALAGGFTSTLPAPFLGGKFTFIVQIAPTTSYVITTSGGANIISGKFWERAGGAGVAGALQDTQNFVANQAIISDIARYNSDGVSWFVDGAVNVSAGVTFAVT